MKTAIATLALLALALPAFAADIAKDPAVVIEGVVTGHIDQINDRGTVAVVSIIDGTFTDQAVVYAGAIGGLGHTADIYYDPMGDVDYGAYDLLFVSTADNWWAAASYPFEIPAWTAYMDGGGKLILIGQDFLYGSGDYGFTTTYCAMGAVVEDTNYSDEGTMDVTGVDVMAGYTESMLPCYEANPWFTDDVGSTQNEICDWVSPLAPGGNGGGSASMVGIFSVVEFSCGGAVDDAVAALFSWLVTTPTEDLSVSTLKTLY